MARSWFALKAFLAAVFVASLCVVPVLAQETMAAAPARKLAGPDGRKPDGSPLEAEEYEDPDHHINAWRERHLSTMKTTQHHHMKGSWLYGQLNAPADAPSDPVACAKSCESREDCYHWMFHVTGHHCSHAHDHGFANEDAIDWIHGHATRFLTKKKGSEL
eukprot:TRINITY_DN4320_c0_g1_i2.p1 TRINITY_DN4320_c0_g1~~TRINITY_DN4320_c0_g1_i2.p1  ORF type:complete len:161 (-),score=25.16 TRINITY_DN4320_c0_g1_i2:93-575(-)